MTNYKNHNYKNMCTNSHQSHFRIIFIHKNFTKQKLEKLPCVIKNKVHGFSLYAMAILEMDMNKKDAIDGLQHVIELVTGSSYVNFL